MGKISKAAAAAAKGAAKAAAKGAKAANKDKSFGAAFKNLDKIDSKRARDPEWVRLYLEK